VQHGSMLRQLFNELPVSFLILVEATSSIDARRRYCRAGSP
jgi:hypothetical protein